jgi:hypothetical protein
VTDRAAAHAHGRGAVAVVGEALVDVVQASPGAPFEAFVGGSPANVAVGLARTIRRHLDTTPEHAAVRHILTAPVITERTAAHIGDEEWMSRACSQRFRPWPPAKRLG